MEKTIVGMCRMKGYARKYGGAHSVPITEDMITGIAETKNTIAMKILPYLVSASPCHKTRVFIFSFSKIFKFLRLYFP